MDTQPLAMEGTTTRCRRRTRLLDVTVLMGGPSSEREVSLVSGGAISAALRNLGHKVTQADISPNDTSALDREGIDVVFIALHGSFGESGQVQELCEKRELRYTGSGPASSELAMDKGAAKEVLKRAGLSTPAWVVPDESHTRLEITEMLARVPLPVVVKPVDGGSSLDCTIARDAATRDAATEDVLGRYGCALIEQYVTGREMTVGVLGAEALPVLEVIPAREFYDYDAKYADDSGTRYVFDHGLDDRTVRAIRSAALTAHNSLECRDLSRVDFILDSAGTPQVLEINTIPGFTAHSLVPMAAKRIGIGFDELVDRLVEMAMARQPSRRQTEKPC